MQRKPLASRITKFKNRVDMRVLRPGNGDFPQRQSIIEQRAAVDGTVSVMRLASQARGHRGADTKCAVYTERATMGFADQTTQVQAQTKASGCPGA